MFGRGVWVSALLLGFALSASATPVDLTTWTALTLDYPGGQGAGSWVLGGGNTYVTQTRNADPSFYLDNTNHTAYSMDGLWRVLSTGDDDYMGFVFGYQNSSNFYLFDWKQGSQGYVGTNAAEGMTIKQLTGATGSGSVDLSLAELWENVVNYQDMEVLAKNHGSDKGWKDDTEYGFHLDFGANPGEIHVVVREGATALWDVTLNDTTFTSGQFGFYNYSQEQVRYMNFEETVVDGGEVPVPGAVLLACIGTGAVGWLRRRRTL